MAITDKFNVNLLLNAAGLAVMERQVYMLDQEAVKSLIYGRSRVLNKVFGVEDIFNGIPYVNDTAIMSVDIDESSRFMEHPIENGTVITDHKVILPIEISLRLVLPSLFYHDIYDQIRDFFYTSKKIIIGTPTNVFFNMILVDMPQELKPETIDRIPLNLHFKEALLVSPKYIKIQEKKAIDPEDSDTSNMGAKQ